MSANRTFGQFLRLSVSGASHARAMRFELENFPAGVRIDFAALRDFMERRAPGRDRLSTQRRESDEVAFESGLKNDLTTGKPLVGVIANRDFRPDDYDAERTIPRPGHADFGQWVEMGRIPTGGGKNSGRLTAPLCAVGGLCRQYLALRGISVTARLVSVGGSGKHVERTILEAKRDQDSVGGIVECRIVGLPAGLGGPLFDSVKSHLAAALWGIPGVTGVEFGLGFAAAHSRGSRVNDPFVVRQGAVMTATDQQGGIMGGRTVGTPVCFRVAFRPTPTIFRPQKSVDLATMRPAMSEMKGRHDPCIARRAVPVVEAMAAFVMADIILGDEAEHPRLCLTLTAKTLREDLAQYRLQRHFVDLVELRADLLQPSELGELARFPSRLPKGVPVILTIRRACDGGAFAGSERDRQAIFRAAFSSRVADRNFSYVDFESDFHVPALEAQARRCGIRIIRSLHSFRGRLGKLSSLLRKLVGNRDEIAKIAFTPRNLTEVSDRFQELAHAASLPPHVVCAMGPLGAATRILSGRMGSLWSYASVEGLGHLGHFSPYRLVRDFRFRSVSRHATLFGVTGWPLSVTRSPEIHNAAFAAEDEDALMIPCPAKTARQAIDFFRTMGLRGLAVTIPHKVDIIPLLDRLDSSARVVGAVNTVSREGGKLVGFNTDVVGFEQAITAFAGDLRGKRAALLGDGGAARAVRFVLRKLGAKVVTFHRQTPPTGYDLLVNATPVDPIPDYVFTGSESVYDLGYSPEVTPLMARARAAKCKVANGLEMLKAQAREQRRIWGM